MRGTHQAAVAAWPRRAAVLALVGTTGAALAAPPPGAPVEVHQRLQTQAPGHAQDLALTLDACSGAYDRRLIATLVQLRIPATLFVTRRWLQANPQALRELLAEPELFELENHGDQHVPAVVGRQLYGMAGPAELEGVRREVSGGAQAVAQSAGRAPRYYRGAGAAYDAASLQAIAQLGYRVGGFSVNGDAGASLPAAGVARRVLKAGPGDIILAHMNHPRSGTAAGLAQALPQLQQRGLRFVKLSQAAGVLELPAP
jgi:peptidoglycan/xylan/chitin deacetylase (PgdA/CDA1 family)